MQRRVDAIARPDQLQRDPLVGDSIGCRVDAPLAALGNQRVDLITLTEQLSRSFGSLSCESGVHDLSSLDAFRQGAMQRAYPSMERRAPRQLEWLLMETHSAWSPGRR